MTLGSPAEGADVVDLRESSPRNHLHQHPSAPPLLRKRVHPIEVIEVLDSPATRDEGEPTASVGAASSPLILDGGSVNDAHQQKLARVQYGTLQDAPFGHLHPWPTSDGSRTRYAPPSARLRQVPQPRQPASGSALVSLNLASSQDPLILGEPCAALPAPFSFEPEPWATDVGHPHARPTDEDAAAPARHRPWLRFESSAVHTRSMHSYQAPDPTAWAWDDDRSGSEPPDESQQQLEQQAAAPLAPGPPHYLRGRNQRLDARQSQPSQQRWTTLSERRMASNNNSSVDATATSQAPGPRSSSPFQEDEQLATRLQRREAVAAERMNREAAVRMQAAMRDQQQEEMLQARFEDLGQQEEQERYARRESGMAAAMAAAAARSQERLSSMRSAREATRAHMNDSWQQMQQARGNNGSQPRMAGPPGSGADAAEHQGNSADFRNPYLSGMHPGGSWGAAREDLRGPAALASRAAATEMVRAMRIERAAAAAAAAADDPLGHHQLFGSFEMMLPPGLEDMAELGGYPGEDASIERSVYSMYGGGAGGAMPHAGVPRGTGARRGSHYVHVREAMVGMLRSGLPPQLLFSDRDFTADDYEMLLKLDEKVESRRGATQTVIDALPVQVIECPEAVLCNLAPTQGVAAADSASPIVEVTSCSICLDEVVGGAVIKTLPCLHRFHQGCIDKWLKQKSSCPICLRDCMSG